MGCSEYVAIGDENTTALVLGEDTEPRRLTDEDLPWPFAVIRSPASYDPAIASHWPHSTVYHRPIHSVIFSSVVFSEC